MAYQRNKDLMYNYLYHKMDKNNFVINISFPDFVKQAHVSLRSTPRLLRELEKDGRIKIFRARGRGLKNVYQVINPPSTKTEG